MTETRAEWMNKGTGEEQYRFTLPQSAMDAIKAITADTSISTSRRFEAVVVLIFGWSLWDQMESIDPTKTAIPQGQWETICELLTHLETDPISSVNYALGFMNSGPSSFKQAIR